MSGAGIKHAASALTLFLRSLPADCYFNVVGFGTRVEKLYPQSVKLDGSSLVRATAHVANMRANLGGTQLLAPLADVLARPAIAGYARQLFVLTDGQVANTEEVVACVAKATDARCFALGLGHGASRGLVEGIARAGRGAADFVLGEGLERIVIRQLKQAMQPSLTGTTLAWTMGDGVDGGDGGPIERDSAPPAAPTGVFGSLLAYVSPAVAKAKAAPTVQQAPWIVPPIFSGERLAVFATGLADEVTSVTLTAQTPDGPLTVTLPATWVEGNTIHTLAAREQIRDLERGTSWLHNIRPGGVARALEAGEAKAAVVQLALAHNLVSSHTSFVAVQAPQAPAVPQAPAAQSGYLIRGGGGERRRRKAGAARGSGSRMLACSLPPPLPPPTSSRSMIARPSMPVTIHSDFEQGAAASSAMLDCMDDGLEECARGRSGARGDASRTWGPTPSPMLPAEKSSKRSKMPSKKKKSKKTSDGSNMLLPPGASTDPVHRLALSQEFDGAFPMSEAVAVALGLTLADFTAAAAALCDGSLDEACLSSAAAVVYFRTVLAGRKDEWELLVEKTLRWLQAKAGQKATLLYAAAESLLAASG
jgi:hypothetical protein